MSDNKTLNANRKVHKNGIIYVIAPTRTIEKGETEDNVLHRLEIREGEKKLSYRLIIGLTGSKTDMTDLVIRCMNVPKPTVNFEKEPIW